MNRIRSIRSVDKTDHTKLLIKKTPQKEKKELGKSIKTPTRRQLLMLGSSRKFVYHMEIFLKSFLLKEGYWSFFGQKQIYFPQAYAMYSKVIWFIFFLIFFPWSINIAYLHNSKIIHRTALQMSTETKPMLPCISFVLFVLICLWLPFLLSCLQHHVKKQKNNRTIAEDWG